MNLSAKIEAILFYKAEPMLVSELSRVLGEKEEAVRDALAELSKALIGRGLTLILNGDEMMLGTAPEVAGILEELAKKELSKDIGRAGLETLTIIAYHAPISRAEIDYLRGVNGTFILRNLLIRGLVERIQNPDNPRSYLYRPTTELLSFLGLKSIKDLPEYQKVREEIEIFRKTTESETDLTP
ncbi:MAG: SMC-Scp complex subunit ScpB [Candidatus Lloydbacteria bacterium CG22_combo_CG10-13_8_21_14_all_47_15]|uniref:SMC-Scp complex subunit ScpB n=1 Tax=Candidatus Lloydbacteria bacterium CG22_combo_CG10-13_8_21_14_all_47_15 TaxID=1974635 RepID=A0A2H0CVD1_9BACT|nr:MAG: SMC-Scp complex subunit ScpB [Candidatus Lloydbacteria bacterium CG22_combo_CG10-13_8_21_14_all_47_15]